MKKHTFYASFFKEKNQGKSRYLNAIDLFIPYITRQSAIAISENLSFSGIAPINHVVMYLTKVKSKLV
ncbi:MAG: hypothetical protein DRH15_06035 [Deltaproteobacteria bacterium]|nr:MAG: hypothetical protein DRH15_06035 [Deltaproteobacteria bacterium]